MSAMTSYQAGLEKYPDNVPLLKAAGRLAVVLGWTEAHPEASGPRGAVAALQAAHKRHTTDFEVQYYLGLALAASGRSADARPHLESAQRFRAWRVSVR